MTYVKINNTLYPASISGRMIDNEWNGRSSKSITLTMTIAEATELFYDDVNWSIVNREIENIYNIDEFDNQILVDVATNDIEFDNSEYSVAGDIIDHRDGTVTVKMGTLTATELLQMLEESLTL